MSAITLERQLIEDEAHVSGDPGSMVFAVRQNTLSALTGTDGDNSPLSVDTNGRLYVTAEVTSVTLSSEYAEDSAAASGDIGQSVLLVREDTLAISTSTDGDYGHFKSTDKGELYTHDADAVALLTTIDTDTSSIATDASTIASDTTSIDATLTALSKSEDAAHVTGDQGIQMLAVRNDTQGTLVSADGDYGSLQLDGSGRLRVIADIDLTGDLVGDDEVDTEDPLKVGGHAYDQGSALAAVSGGDKVNNATDLYRRQLISDAPNIGSASAKITIGTIQAAIPNDDVTIATATPLAGRIRMIVQNQGNKSIFIGPTGVTTLTGIEVGQKASMALEIGESVDLFAISGTDGQNVRVLELA